MTLLIIINTTTVSIYVSNLVIYLIAANYSVISVDLGDRYAHAKSIFNRQRNYPSLLSIR